MTLTADAEDLNKIHRILGGIYTVSKNSMIEQSSKSGNSVREAVRDSFERKTTEWRQEYHEGRRLLIKGGVHALGRRIAHRNGGGLDDPDNMKNLILSKTHVSTGTTVVGGVFKGFRPINIKDGKIVGYRDKIQGVSRQTIAILEKLNYGNRSGKYEEYLRWKDTYGDEVAKSMDGMEKHWKARRFFEEGWNNSKTEVLRKMTTKLEELIGKRASSTDLTQERQYAV